MKTIPLTRGYVALVDDEDFEALSKFKWSASLSKSGRVCAVRAVKIGGKWTSLLMHREILNAPAGMHIDHINHNATDNRKANLRLVSCHENAKNQSLPSHNTSGACGIYWDAENGKWRAQLAIKGRNVALGRFTSKQSAIFALAHAKSVNGYHPNHGIALSATKEVLK